MSSNVSTNATSDRIPLRARPEPQDVSVPRPAAALEAARARPHVCFVAPTTWPVLSRDPSIRVIGGAEVQQSMLAPGLVRRGFRVSMICLDYGQPDRAVVDGVTVYRIHRPDAGLPVMRFVHPRLTSMWNALRRIDADIYYQRTAAIDTALVAHFCRRHGRRSIYAGASDVDFVPGEEEIRFSRDRRIFRWGVRRVDDVVLQNEAQRATLARNYGRDGVLIPSCFEPPPGARADRSGYVLWAATMRPSKRPEMLLEIARRLPRHRFVLIGGPDEGRRAEEYMRSVAEAAARLPNVEVKGFIPFAEADRWFNGARLLVNTSLYEGFPNTFLQAWSRGVPTVAFVDTGSLHEGAPVYDVARDVSDMSARIERLMRDDILWHEASRRAAEHFRDRHSIDAVLDRYERVLVPKESPR